MTLSGGGSAPIAEPEADLADSGRYLLELRPHLRDLRGWSDDRLVEAVSDASLPLARRHAAGLQLALVGDPRVEVRIPALVDIPAGEVEIGLPTDRVDEVAAEWAALGVQRDWIVKEVPRHAVSIAAFRMAVHPVTNFEYLRYVLEVRQAERPTSWPHGTFPLLSANQPVHTVSPDAADGYVAWLADTTGRHFRLPSEAEWEYAASGGDGRQYPWGDTWDPARANTAEAGPLTTTPVGIYVEGHSPFGIADMAGNVEEYVADAYRPYPGAAVVHDDLVDLYGSSYRVARGGSYARHGDLARCSRRHGWYPSDHYAMGFRVAETP